MFPPLLHLQLFNEQIQVYCPKAQIKFKLFNLVYAAVQINKSILGIANSEHDVMTQFIIGRQLAGKGLQIVGMDGHKGIEAAVACHYMLAQVIQQRDLVLVFICPTFHHTTNGIQYDTMHKTSMIASALQHGASLQFLEFEIGRKQLF